MLRALFILLFLSGNLSAFDSSSTYRDLVSRSVLAFASHEKDSALLAAYDRRVLGEYSVKLISPPIVIKVALKEDQGLIYFDIVDPEKNKIFYDVYDLLKKHKDLSGLGFDEIMDTSGSDFLLYKRDSGVVNPRDRIFLKGTLKKAGGILSFDLLEDRDVKKLVRGAAYEGQSGGVLLIWLDNQWCVFVP